MFMLNDFFRGSTWWKCKFMTHRPYPHATATPGLIDQDPADLPESPRNSLGDATAAAIVRTPANAISVAMKLDQSVALAYLHQTRAVSKGRPTIPRDQRTERQVVVSGRLHEHMFARMPDAMAESIDRR
jgi:hypothetical protein